MPNQNNLTADHIRNILSVEKKDKYAVRDSCIINMCYFHGLRTSELCNIKVSDINLRNNEIYVRRLKNGTQACHPILPQEKNKLLEWFYYRNYWRDADSPWLFISQKGQKLCRQHIYRIIMEYAKLAGIGFRVSPHMLREACRHKLFSQCADIALIEHYLGNHHDYPERFITDDGEHFQGLWDEQCQ